MSAKIALSAKLPGDEEVNGLDSLHRSIIDNPHQVIVALVWLDVPKVTIDTESDDPELAQRPTVRVRRIEPFGAVDKVPPAVVEPFGAVDKVPPAVVELFQELQQQRTGRRPLPFDELRPTHSHVEFSNRDDTDGDEPDEDED